MKKKLPEKPTVPVKVNFLSDEDKTISKLPIFVARAREGPKKKTTTKIKKAPDDI